VKIVLVHNSYQEPGGEDVVFEQERQLLKEHGHRVVAYIRSNHEIKNLSAIDQIALAKRAVWASDTHREFSRLLEIEQPDLAHIHNTLLVISPSIYSACHERGTPVVQTLHNFRLLCPAATFHRNGKVCEECVEQGLWRSVCHGCYRNSRRETAAVALMLYWHRRTGTWQESVTRYIALTEFSRAKFVAAGFPEDRIVVKPHFVAPDPCPQETAGEYALFVGRLCPEKGVATLLRAWEQVRARVPLRIVGDGPEREKLEEDVKRSGLAGVAFLGHLSRRDTIAAAKSARFMVVPTLWYETFGMVVIEAFACGKPVICSRLGPMSELVEDGRTGLHFAPGNSSDLAQKIDWALEHPAEMAEMGRAARKEFETRYTAERNYSLLMEVYEQTVSSYV